MSLEKSRSYTKAGPGRMPYRRTPGSRGRPVSMISEEALRLARITPPTYESLFFDRVTSSTEPASILV